MQHETPPPSGENEDYLGGLQSIGRIDVRTGPELLANMLREKILSGMYAYGSALNPDRDLVAQVKLSRPTVRAALRILETEGLVETRQGRNGGTFVRRVDEGNLSRSLNLFIRGLPVDVRSILEARSVLEVAIVRFAAERRSDDDLARMESLIEKMEAVENGDPIELIRLNIALRLVMTRAAKNDVLTGIVSAFSDIDQKPTAEDIRLAGFLKPSDRREMVENNRRIVAAVRKRDPEAAARRMTRHFEQVRHLFDQHIPHEDTAKKQLSGD